MLLFLLPGWFQLRAEARRFVELLFHEPPRRLDRTPLSIIHDPAWHLTTPDWRTARSARTIFERGGRYCAALAHYEGADQSHSKLGI